MESKNLFNELSKLNSQLSIKNSVSNKYNYPVELQKLSSKNPKKANFRHNLQKITLKFLSKKELTKTDFNQFNDFLKMFISDFKGINKDTNIRTLYSFKIESHEKECEKVLNEYKKFIEK